jgi:tetratricopeptide (TPR) repeat protein
MRRALVIATILYLGGPAPARAGIYNFAEPLDKFGTYEEFKEALVFLRQINSTKIDTPQRQRYLLMADLAERGVPASLDDVDRVSLSGYLLRLNTSNARKNERLYLLAAEILQPVVRRDPKNFLAQANLAAAWMKLGQYQRAESTHSVALEQWPRRWQDLTKEQQQLLSAKLHWNEAQFQRYREVEKYQHKLLLLRLREAQRKSPARGLYPLFDTADAQVQFVGPGGKYEPGKLAAEERRKLPKDALAVVEQLVLWEPDDPRLLWLAAELYNAEGNGDAARDLIRYVIEVDQFVTPELKEHRDVLVRQAPAKQRRALDFTEPAPADGQQIDSPSPWPTNPWQLLGVGFGAGAVVALLGVWQVREIRRRVSARP